jgi:peptide/nickel transport system permease protein
MSSIAPESMIGDVRATAGRRVGRGLLGRARGVPRLLIVGFIGLVVLLAVFGPLLAPFDPKAPHLNDVFAKPGADYLLGTDEIGRDVLSRTIAGARTAVLGALLITIGGLLVGAPLGLLAGYRGGRIDAAISRWADFMIAIPALLVAIVVVGVLSGGYWMAVALLVLLQSPFDTRIVRGGTLEQRGRPYVEAARTLGVSDWTIMRRHIFPNLLSVIVPNAALTFTYALVTLAGLAFLGLGVAPGEADWGLMVAENRAGLYANPWATLAPALMLMLLATSVSFLGDILYERFEDQGGGR